MEWECSKTKTRPWNALGKVKFLFPNSHSIYLHDTPGKTVFGHDQRAFSHGCIRVSDPKRLANYLLRNQPEWTPEKDRCSDECYYRKICKDQQPGSGVYCLLYFMGRRKRKIEFQK